MAKGMYLRSLHRVQISWALTLQQTDSNLERVSVHNLIIGKTESGEVAIVNPWAWSPEYQVVSGVAYSDLTTENFGVIVNEHLRQDIGGVLSWELGVGPRDANTVYVRSHEYGVQERIENFDPATTKLSFLYFGTKRKTVG